MFVLFFKCFLCFRPLIFRPSVSKIVDSFFKLRIILALIEYYYKLTTIMMSNAHIAEKRITSTSRPVQLLNKTALQPRARRPEKRQGCATSYYYALSEHQNKGWLRNYELIFFIALKRTSYS